MADYRTIIDRVRERDYIVIPSEGKTIWKVTEIHSARSGKINIQVINKEKKEHQFTLDYGEMVFLNRDYYRLLEEMYYSNFIGKDGNRFVRDNSKQPYKDKML